MAKTRISKARISLRGISLRPRSLQALLVGLVALACLSVGTSQAGPIQWATVGDPGNAADTRSGANTFGRGAVTSSFQIMKYEFTNQQYTDFLIAVAATDPYSLYNPLMGSDIRGGITQSGVSGSYSYTVRQHMGDKPVNYVSWFDAARVANWYQNGATSSSSTETGAYTLLNGQTSGNAVAVNSDASYFIPTQDQWYKAAYFAPNYGGAGVPGYWVYATQSGTNALDVNTQPTAVTAGLTGIGSAGDLGNSANWNNAAGWNGATGNVTTVGTNGGPSFYETFDMSGNVYEWNDLNGLDGSGRQGRGGFWSNTLPIYLSSSIAVPYSPSEENVGLGFRLAAVPEPSTWVMGLAGLACGAWQAVRRRRRAR